MGLFYFGDDKVYRQSFYTVLCCGCAGVLVDLDHFIAYYFIQVEGGRFLHLPVFILGCLVLFSLGAYLGGLVFKDLLK